jgi:rhamnose transport system ATP-binding protein
MSFAVPPAPNELPDLLLSIRSASKAYGGVHALRAVSLDLRAGEVHALVGENGAGKSTLVKIITGAETADAGEILVNGRSVTANSPALARSLGIAAIYQQPALFPDLSVAENIALALETHSPGAVVDWGARRRRARELLGRIGAAIDPDREASSLTMPEQQLVEIAKALGAGARILILDEPTACLSDREAEALFRLVDELRAGGAGLLYITHRLTELRRIADRVTVLRDGQAVATCGISEVSPAELIRLMVGRELSAIFPKQEVPRGEVVLELRALGCRLTGVHDVNLAVHAGEILGIAGLVGSGRTELANVLFGLTPADQGEILVEGRRVRIDSPEQACALGFGYVPEDRRQAGVIGPMAVAQNVSLASLAAISRYGFLQEPEEYRLAETYCRQLEVKTPSLDTPVVQLSGGNQQKVALARWMATDPRVMILDEPTQGVDVGAKIEVYRIIGEMAARGLAVILISSDLDEILGLCDRVAVMASGSVTAVLGRAEATPEKILALALGHPVGVGQ